jgi:hypothetical protein
LGGVLTQGTVAALASFGALYVGGNFSTPVGHSLLRWNGTTWSAAGNPTMGGRGARSARVAGIHRHDAWHFVPGRGGQVRQHWGRCGERRRKGRVGRVFVECHGHSARRPLGRGPVHHDPVPGLPRGVRDRPQHQPGACCAMEWNCLEPHWQSWPDDRNRYGPTDCCSTVAHSSWGSMGRSGAEAVFRFTNDWTPLAGKGFSAPVQCLASDGPSAIAGGAFAVADGVIVHGIARRSGTNWGPLGAGVSGGTATVLAVGPARATARSSLVATSPPPAALLRPATSRAGTAAPGPRSARGTNGTVRSPAGLRQWRPGGRWRLHDGGWRRLQSHCALERHCLESPVVRHERRGALPHPTGHRRDRPRAARSRWLAGVACSRVASWNGSSWSAIDIGMKRRGPRARVGGGWNAVRRWLRSRRLVAAARACAWPASTAPSGCRWAAA